MSDRTKRRVAGLLIFVVAFALRLFHIWQLRRSPFFSVLLGDARSYDEWAQRIAAGDWIGHDVFYQAPLYPYFLALIYRLGGHSLMTVRIVQAVIGSCSCVMLATAASLLFSPIAGILAGSLLAVYAPAIFFDALLQKAVLDVFLLSLALWLIAEITVKSRWGAWLGLGVSIGALGLTRENALIFIIAIAAWAVLRFGMRSAPFALGVVLVLLPVAVRNSIVGGGFYITTSQFGTNFYIGNHASADGTYQSLRYGRGSPEYERQDATELAERALHRKLAAADVSAFWTDRALAFITSNPISWLKLMGRKVMLLLNATEMVDTEDQASYAEWSSILRFFGPILHFGLLVPLALIGIFATWSDRSRLWILYALIIAYSASVVLFYVFARYRYPLVPMLILFASAGITVVLKKPVQLIAGDANLNDLGLAPPSEGGGILRRKKWNATLASPQKGVVSNQSAVLEQPPRPRRVFGSVTNRSARPPLLRKEGLTTRSLERMRADYLDRLFLTQDSRHVPGWLFLQVAAIVVVTIFANWPLGSTSAMRAVTETNLGAALQTDHRLDEAISHYRRAITVDSDYAPAYSNLATALREQKRTDDAAANYRQALKLQPEFASAHYNLANLLLEQGDAAAAADHFETAIRDEPPSADAHNNYGIALASVGRMEEASREFRQAIELDASSATTYRNLADALSSLGRTSDAIAALRRAVELDPNDAAIHYDLASGLLEVGKLDQAILEFRTSLRLAPGQVAAHNNLGIALGSQGKLDEAIEEFRRALSIQPDFADAQRNLAMALAARRTGLR
jgi:tetratricopeptide (TPR) repeat protein